MSLAPHAMEMLARQRVALEATIRASRSAGLYTNEEIVVYNAQKHVTMHSFSTEFSTRFGELVASGADVLLLHAGASLTDRKDSLGLPVQAVGLTRQRVVVLIRTVSAHRIVGERGPMMDQVVAVLQAAGVGPLAVEPWPICDISHTGVCS